MGDHLSSIDWENLPKKYTRLPYLDPVIYARSSMRACLTIKAQEVLGWPDQVVLMQSANRVGIRRPREGDISDIVREIEVGGTFGTSGYIKTGYYLLRPTEECFVLEPLTPEEASKLPHGPSPLKKNRPSNAVHPWRDSESTRYKRGTVLP